MTWATSIRESPNTRFSSLIVLHFSTPLFKSVCRLNPALFNRAEFPVPATSKCYRPGHFGLLS